MDSFRYKILTFEDLPLLLSWYNLPHVRKWYSKKRYNLAQLQDKYKHYISGKYKIQGFICYYNGAPCGYIQYYPVAHHAWDEHGLGSKLKRSGGIDIFIGEEKFLGLGLAKPMINRFIQKHVFTKFDYCLVDPEIKNTKAIACYQKCGFDLHKKVDTEDGVCHLMIKKKSKITYSF